MNGKHSSVTPPLPPRGHRSSSQLHATGRPVRPRGRLRYAIGITLLSCLALCTTAGMIFTGWLYLTSSGTDLRYMMADSLITTQHREWAKYLIGQDALDSRVRQYEQRFDAMDTLEAKSEKPSRPAIAVAAAKPPEKKLIEVEPVEGNKFKGYILYVHDPKALRIVVPNRVGKGEKVTSMVARTGALAGVNAGGFNDPNWKGNGFQPIGLVLSGGQIYYNDNGDNPTSVVGIDKDGVLITGKYRPSELLKMGVREAVTFSPRFILDGKGLIPNEREGWGIAPRTAIAQKKDGTIMFAIIDGRQPGHSIGATLYDVQELLLERGAVTAANLDGGSSTVLVVDNKIVNKPCSPYGERYLPTAFLVFDHPEDVKVGNIWAGLDIHKIDASKW